MMYITERQLYLFFLAIALLYVFMPSKQTDKKKRRKHL